MRDKEAHNVSTTHRAAQIRASLGHPVIDGDGHWMEPIPVFLEYLSEVGGPKAVDAMRAYWHRNSAWYRASDAERQHRLGHVGEITLAVEIVGGNTFVGANLGNRLGRSGRREHQRLIARACLHGDVEEPG